ncbi:uncharacterized protein LOC130648091 [Hydractinia symbiolongicarpus]|uniref:uncharacterized protein LOC130648091 n=1 Tax=Hydractinia symbiolongicarpus TaxID=13093 RepID=UPI00254BD061|nr:uncharacterized protein LOC130648091 [Hydractinia symbiolongicarpus]
MESICTLLQVAVQEDWNIHQMDVKGAYLHAPIECQVYVQPAPGYETANNVWKLNKSLYGLKQSGRNWHQLLHDFLCDIGFVQSHADPCVFVRRQCGYTIRLLVWVDDIIITSSKDELLNTVKIQLKNRFNMKDLGTLSSFLGIDFERGIDYVTMSQSRYLKNVLIRFSLNDCKPRNTPCEQNPAAYILDETSDTEKTDNDTKLYRLMVGSIVYAMTCSRPDLSYVVTKLSQHLSKPENSDWIMVKHVFRYIKNTVSYTFTFRKLNHEEFRLYAFCDADWASSLDNGRSITGYCISINPSGPPISWRSKKQASVALSTCEAEFMALSLTAQETAYLTRLIKDLTNFDLKPPVIKNDNQGTLALLKNPVKHMKAKHIDIRYHYIRECFQQNQIAVEYIPSSENKADIFTKPQKKHLLTMFKQYLFGE